MLITDFLGFVSPYNAIYLYIFDTDGNLIIKGYAPEIDSMPKIAVLHIDSIQCIAANEYKIYVTESVSTLEE